MRAFSLSSKAHLQHRMMYASTFRKYHPMITLKLP